MSLIEDFSPFKTEKKTADGICSEHTFIYIYAVLSHVQKGNQEENCGFFFFFPIALSSER